MKCVYVRTDLCMKLHTELGRLCCLCPNLASKIDSSNHNFEAYVTTTKSEFPAFQPVTVSHVYHLLLGLSSDKATGIDKISCKIIRIAARSFQIH